MPAKPVDTSSMASSYVNASFEYSGEALAAYLNRQLSVESALHRPSVEISLAWRNLRYEVTDWAFQRKAIIRRLNGFFEVGTLNGLMGPSGAGKTTLLNCLSGTEKLGLSDDSEVYLNGKQTKSTVSYFIEQHVQESIVGQLTIGQILRYAFSFKNGISHSSEETERYISQIIKELLLDESILERPFERCSGGEQKRIAIAQELMAIEKPAFLFVDEPTTGLDSAAAYEVMLCLQKLVKAYRITVIASIHAPNDETLNLFDKVYVLAKGGVAIYSGPPGGIQAQLDKVEYQMINEQPPIEALIRIACNGSSDPVVSKLANLTHSATDQAISNQQSSLSYQASGLPSRRKSFSLLDFFLQSFRLMRVTFIAKSQSLLFSYLLLVIYFLLMVSLFSSSMTTASSCFSKSADTVNASNAATCQANIQEDILIRENVNFLTYVLMYTGMIITGTSAMLFSSYVKVFRNEHRNYWYSLGVFFWSALLISFIELTIYSFFNSSLGYFLPAQHAIDGYTLNWSRFGLYFLFMWLLCLYMQSFGQLIGILLVDHTEFAIIACLLTNAIMLLMNGLFVDMARNENPLVAITSTIFANKYISYGILYTFYGFQRCDWESEYSIIVQFFHMDLNGAQEWATHVLVNILVLRALTLLVMYLKFGSFSSRALFRLFKKCKDEHSIASDLIAIDFERSVVLDGLNNNPEIVNLEKSKAEKEAEFDQFSRGKILIGWRNLSLFGKSTIYEVGSKKEAKRQPILRNLNGHFRFGTLNALMGTSGAGKTSLLKVLNGRAKTRLSDETRIYLSQFTTIQSAFITQEVGDHLMPGLTAKQMLVYASRLKNNLEKVDHEAIALKWLQELNLQDTSETKVEKCSGGERKRLAVALELTALLMPNCVCIDEPTSGLDTNSAEIVISTLRRLTENHPMTIITSIHQPTSEVLLMFDQIYVLARGGVCIFSGAPSQIKPHLTKIPKLMRTDSKYAIETLIKSSCNSHTDPVVQMLVEHNESQFKLSTADLLQDTQLVLDGVHRNRHRFSLHSAYTLLLRYLAYFRGHLWLESLFFAFNYFFYGFALRFFYDEKMIHIDGCLNIQEDDTSTCRRTLDSVEELYQLLNNFKFNFFYTNFFLFFVVFQCSMSFLKELRFFKNEHRNGWYSSGSLYLMKSFFEIIPIIPIIMFYVYICNWYEPIRPGIYWNFVLIFLLGAIAFQGMAHIFALLSRGNITILILISLTVFLLFTLISNFLLSFSRLHYIWQFISNIAVSRFIFEAVMLLIYGFGRCASNEIQQLLYTMAINDSYYSHAIMMLIFNIVFYRVIAIYLLCCKGNPVDNRKQRVARISNYVEKLEPAKAHIPGIGGSKQIFTVKVKAPLNG